MDAWYESLISRQLGRQGERLNSHCNFRVIRLDPSYSCICGASLTKRLETENRPTPKGERIREICHTSADHFAKKNPRLSPWVFMVAGVWSEEPKNRPPGNSPRHSLKFQTGSDNKMSVCHPRKSLPTGNFLSSQNEVSAPIHHGRR